MFIQLIGFLFSNAQIFFFSKNINTIQYKTLIIISKQEMTIV